MTIQATVSIPSIAPRSCVALDDGDVSVTATFRPCSPIGSTEVVTSLDPLTMPPCSASWTRRLPA